MGNTDSKELQKIQAECGYTFKDKALLQQCLTHDSLRGSNPNLPTYQRLEFLGDSVLRFIITDYLYHKYPEEGEGSLSWRRTAMVNRDKQLEIAEKIKLREYVQMGASNNGQTAGNKFKRYDKFVEALIGGIYLDAGGGQYGHNEAKNSVYKLWGLEKLPGHGGDSTSYSYSDDDYGWDDDSD